MAREEREAQEKSRGKDRRKAFFSNVPDEKERRSGEDRRRERRQREDRRSGKERRSKSLTSYRPKQEKEVEDGEVDGND